MNKINRKLEYALMASAHELKILGELTTAKEVSDSFHTPFDATARVMQQMAQEGGAFAPNTELVAAIKSPKISPKFLFTILSS